MSPRGRGSSSCCTWGLEGSRAVPGEALPGNPCQGAVDSHWHCCCSWWRLKWWRGAKQSICICCRLWSLNGVWLGSGFSTPGSPAPHLETKAGHVLGWKLKKTNKSLLRSTCTLFLLFLSFYLLPPSFFSSLPPPLWSGGKGIFITLIRSPVLGWPFEVWLPAPSVQERILGTAGFLLLFLCIYKLASLSFLFFCFICLCFPSLIKPVSLPLTGSPSLVIIITHLFFFILSVWSFPFLYCASSFLSFLPSFLLSSVCWDFFPQPISFDTCFLFFLRCS